jgi:hypothetical protein
MSDDIDRTLDALRVQIKKEIVDNYFNERVFLEEDIGLLREEAAAYREAAANLEKGFLTLYAALGSEAVIHAWAKLAGLEEKPFYEKFSQMTEAQRQGLLQGVRRRGLTRWRRYRHLVFDLYEQLFKTVQNLKEQYENLQAHLGLTNEDVKKFNLSFDFGLIAAQIEALEGHEAIMPGGLESGEREELSTRMRLKQVKIAPEEAPPPPEIPPLETIKPPLTEILASAPPL